MEFKYDDEIKDNVLSLLQPKRDLESFELLHGNKLINDIHNLNKDEIINLMSDNGYNLFFDNIISSKSYTGNFINKDLMLFYNKDNGAIIKFIKNTDSAYYKVSIKFNINNGSNFITENNMSDYYNNNSNVYRYEFSNLSNIISAYYSLNNLNDDITYILFKANEYENITLDKLPPNKIDVLNTYILYDLLNEKEKQVLNKKNNLDKKEIKTITELMAKKHFLYYLKRYEQDPSVINRNIIFSFLISDKNNSDINKDNEFSIISFQNQINILFKKNGYYIDSGQVYFNNKIIFDLNFNNYKFKKILHFFEYLNTLNLKKTNDKDDIKKLNNWFYELSKKDFSFINLFKKLKEYQIYEKNLNKLIENKNYLLEDELSNGFGFFNFLYNFDQSFDNKLQIEYIKKIDIKQLNNICSKINKDGNTFLFNLIELYDGDIIEILRELNSRIPLKDLIDKYEEKKDGDFISNNLLGTIIKYVCNEVFHTTLTNPDKIIKRLETAQEIIRYFKEIGVDIDSNIRLKRAFFYDKEEFHIHNDLLFNVNQLNEKIPFIQKIMNNLSISEDNKSHLSKELLNFLILIDKDINIEEKINSETKRKRKM